MTKEPFNFVPKQTYAVGYCVSTYGNYCTMLHKLPCSASICNDMELSGWTLYAQPQEYISSDFNQGYVSYVATWRKIVKAPSRPNKNSRSIPVKVD